MIVGTEVVARKKLYATNFFKGSNMKKLTKLEKDRLRSLYKTANWGVFDNLTDAKNFAKKSLTSYPKL